MHGAVNKQKGDKPNHSACGLCYLLRIYESQEIKGLHTAFLGLLFKGCVCMCVPSAAWD